MNNGVDVLHSRRVAGLELGDAATLLPLTLAVLESSSVDADEYVRLLEGAAVKEEMVVLASILFSGALGAELRGRAAYQSDDQVELCRDAFKTVLLVKVPPMERDPGFVRKQVGRQLARSRLDVLPNDACFLFLGNGAMELRQLSLDPQSQGKKLVDHGVSRFSAGQVMRVRRDLDAFDTISVRGDVWLLQVVINEHSDLVHHYDRSTLQRTGASSSSFHATRMEFVMDILRCFPVEGATEMLSSIYHSSRFYFVRWKAVQTMFRLDFDRAKPMLMRAVDDVHPQVRSAARRTLSNLSQQGHI